MWDHCHSRYTPCGVIVTYICCIIKMKKVNTDGGTNKVQNVLPI
jgi:hypothetical protein